MVLIARIKQFFARGKPATRAMRTSPTAAIEHIVIRKDGSTHTFLAGTTAYGTGHEPHGGHKPVTIGECGESPKPVPLEVASAATRPLDSLTDDELADLAEQALENEAKSRAAHYDHSQTLALRHLRERVADLINDSSDNGGNCASLVKTDQ